MDFLNLEKVIRELLPEEHFSKKGVDFTIRKSVSDDFILKEIDVNFEQKTHHFLERVQALNLDKLSNFAASAGLEIQHVFGDYELNPYDVLQSDRLILVMQ